MKMYKVISVIFLCVFSISVAFSQKGKGQDNKKVNNAQDTEQQSARPDNQGGKDNQHKQEQTKKRENTGKKDQKEEQTQTREQKKDGDQHQVREQKKEGEQRGRGHAYGRDKGDISGRDFGMIRSEESRNKMKGKFDDADAELDRQDNVVSGMFNNIEQARTRNEEKYQKGTISKSEYEHNKNKIQEAEQIATQAQIRVKDEKKKVENSRKQMEE